MLNNYRATKSKIFLAASKLFSQKCYADVGIREIAVEAGIKVPTVYNHYASKEAILEDLFRFLSDRISRDYNSVKQIDFDQDPMECFKKIIFIFDDSEVELMRQLMRILFNEQHRSPQAARILYDIVLREGKKIDYAILSHLNDKGVIQCDENEIENLAEIFSRVVITFAMQFVRDDEIAQRPDYESIMTSLLKIILMKTSRQEQEKEQEYFLPNFSHEYDLSSQGCVATV